jgi:hypothetical protein
VCLLTDRLDSCCFCYLKLLSSRNKEISLKILMKVQFGDGIWNTYLETTAFMIMYAVKQRLITYIIIIKIRRPLYSE